MCMCPNKIISQLPLFRKNITLIDFAPFTIARLGLFLLPCRSSSVPTALPVIRRESRKYFARITKPSYECCFLKPKHENHTKWHHISREQDLPTFHLHTYYNIISRSHKTQPKPGWMSNPRSRK